MDTEAILRETAAYFEALAEQEAEQADPEAESKNA